MNTIYIISINKKKIKDVQAMMANQSIDNRHDMEKKTERTGTKSECHSYKECCTIEHCNFICIVFMINFQKSNEFRQILLRKNSKII